jgi:cytochrome b
MGKIVFLICFNNLAILLNCSTKKIKIKNVEDDNMKKLRAFLLKTNMRFSNLVNNQKGSQTLEWIGIAAVVVIVVGLISTAFSSNTEFGTTVLDKFKGWIEKMGGE